MSKLDEQLSEQFHWWEVRGRGWQVFESPVSPEPPFRPFEGHFLPSSPPIDDGRKPTFLSSLVDRLTDKLAPKQEPEAVTDSGEEEPEPVWSEEPLTSELVASLPGKLLVSDEAWSAFLDSLHACSEPVAFELLTSHQNISLQFATCRLDAAVFARQLTAYLPEVTFSRTEERLAETWSTRDGVGFIAEFGLAHEFMLPLHTKHAVDPFVGIVAALSELRAGESAVFQVLFQPVRNAWAGNIWRSVTDDAGKALFVNHLQLIPGTKAKLESPLFGVVVRVAAKAEDFDRAADIVRDVAGALRPFTAPEGNRLIPISNDEYPFEAHEEDLLARQSRRSGMILNRNELVGFVHLPSDEVRSTKLRRERTRTKAAPPSTHDSKGILLGHNHHAGRVTPVHLGLEQRMRHTHVIGASGTGKSTLLFNLIREDIERGEGVAVLDPHGDLIHRVLGIIPPERVKDVILVDPGDEQYSIGFNILSAHSDLERNLLASDLVSVFQRLSTSWGDQLSSVLRNAVLAFLDSSEPGTLSDLRRFLIEPAFREKFLSTVRDPDIAYYWHRAFPQLSGNKSIGPVLTRLDTFLAPKPIRYMVSQSENRLDFADILNSGKIFLAKLPHGEMGRENSYLLGSLFVSKFQQAAMSRQAQSAESRRPFFLYIDEFQDFITPSMAEMLTGVRKYRLGLILAHQDLRQLERDREAAGAVMGISGTRVVFRVGDADSRSLENGFASFEARDLQNLETGEAICRIEKADGDFNLAVPLLPELDATTSAKVRERVIAASRSRYATPRADIEAAVRAKMAAEQESKASTPREVSKDSKPEPTVVAKPTDSEKKSVESPTPVVKEPKPPTDMGRGGPEHQAIQQALKAQAEQLGFRAIVEKSVLEGQGSVDLALERADRSIACEITITTSIHHEVENVLKCLKAGFEQVAVISPKAERLQQIGEALRSELDAESLARVAFFTPDQFSQHLNAMAAAPAAQPKAAAIPATSTSRGFQIRRHAPKLTDEERRAKEESSLKMLTEAMKKRNET